MNKLIIKLILSLTIITSCNIKTDRQESKSQNNDLVQNENINPIDTNSIDYLIKANEFVIKVLGDKLRTHEFLNIQEAPRHLEIFSADGLIKVKAFSNKDFPKQIDPNYYEHFTLFCLEYVSKNHAELAFQELSRLTKYDLDKMDALDTLTTEKVKFIVGQSKPGGLILQKGKWIFSLVETCRDIPIGGSWIDYENLFISYISEDTITVLNADCGKMKYIEKQIKPAHNTQ